jgi:hypothetical protein
MHHESKLNQAAASVTEWQGRIRAITENVAIAADALSESQKRRQEHILSAALGDHGARERLDHVLEEDRKAELDLEILRSSLQIAETELASADRAKKAAEADFRRSEVERLARLRCLAAAEIDQAFSDFAAAWSDYESLGHELLDLASQEPNSNALYLSETISGEARLVASLPAKPFLSIRERFNFLPISTSKSLATSEAQYWRLPAIEEDKAA